MKPIKDIIIPKVPFVMKAPPHEKPKKVTRKLLLLTDIARKINQSRDGKKYKKITPSGVKYFAPFSIPVLEYIYSTCTQYEREGSGTFSKCFFGSVKPRIGLSTELKEMDLQFKNNLLK